MTALRAAKIAGIAADLPPAEVEDPSGEARLLVVGWGSTYGPITAAARRVRNHKRKVATLHLRQLSPLPSGLLPTILDSALGLTGDQWLDDDTMDGSEDLLYAERAGVPAGIGSSKAKASPP